MASKDVTMFLCALCGRRTDEHLFVWAQSSKLDVNWASRSCFPALWSMNYDPFRDLFWSFFFFLFCASPRRSPGQVSILGKSANLGITTISVS